MKYAFDRSFRFKLGEHWWEAYLVTSQEMGELTEDDDDMDEDTPAYVSPEDRTLVVQEGSVKVGILRHELWHAWQEKFRIGSANITVDQYEEVVAEFMAGDVEVFLRKVNSIYRRFLKFEGAK